MILLVLGVCILGSQVSAASLTCRNEAAQSIDFWTSVKFPRPTGTRYTYTDNTLEQTEWMLGDDLAATSGNPLSATLAPLYADASFGYIMYNDEIPTSSGGSTSSTKAHAKGVIGFGPDGGFWLVHSVPKFPDRPSVSDYTGIASGQQINAQSFLCLSMTPSTLEKVAQLVGIEDLNIYSTVADVPANLAQHVGGEPFVGFATSSTDIGGGSKTRQYLYEDLVTKYFQSSLDVSTWPDEANFESSDCPTSGFVTQNVQGVSVKEAELGWKNTVDHSKWCVTAHLAQADGNQVVAYVRTLFLEIGLSMCQYAAIRHQYLATGDKGIEDENINLAF
ncbi:hypothetical protein WJX74_002125 [Apatococcus lobatus]|uniref:Uncharacterized protein n=1 Tax=Apatococcus lobatus TaxID=904363 RepID=A0AAW1RQC6_9CHLO